MLADTHDERPPNAPRASASATRRARSAGDVRRDGMRGAAESGRRPGPRDSDVDAAHRHDEVAGCCRRNVGDAAATCSSVPGSSTMSAPGETSSSYRMSRREALSGWGASTVLSPPADDQQQPAPTRGSTSNQVGSARPHDRREQPRAATASVPPVRVVLVPPDLLCRGGPLRVAGALRAPMWGCAGPERATSACRPGTRPDGAPRSGTGVARLECGHGRFGLVGQHR